MSTPSPLPFVDLWDVPFTVSGSRFLLRDVDGELGIYYVRYEVPLADCLIATLPKQNIEDGLQVGLGGVRCRDWSAMILGDEVRIQSTAVAPSFDDEVAERGCEVVRRNGGWVIRSSHTAASVLSDADFVAAANRVMEQWMDRCPQVLPQREEMARQCWWVLGGNIVDLTMPNGETARGVVPSKVGYVGVWQWDAYFIALGLRHGDPALAAEQIDIAFTPAPDGQLPDVVHEAGILASSEDLPASDIKTLHAKSKTDTDLVVPLTKPPLAAWAARRVLDYLDEDEAATLWRRWKPIVLASQEWWLRYGAGEPPRYEHPYSSGLDDSPVFDAGGAVVSPDLLAYLIVQQELLDDSVSSRAGTEIRKQLEDLWDERFQTYLPQHLDRKPITHYTVLSLLALFAGRLPQQHLDQIVGALKDPGRFASEWPLPTVAMSDPQFDPEEMWRGPTWVNTTYLVAEGLELCGLPDLAKNLRSKTLNGVEQAGGPVEHWNPLTGMRARTATVSFGWSAALYVDLAVREYKG